MPSEDVQVPDIFGSDQRAETVAAAIMGGQKALVDLQAQQRLNGDEDSAPIPGAQPKPGQAQPQTYGERRQQLEAGIRLLMEDNADVREQIEAVAAQWQRERNEARGIQSPEQGDRQ